RRQVLMGLGAAGLLGAWTLRGRLNPGRNARSLPQLAIIPFTAESSDSRLTMLGESLANEVIRALALSPHLFVVGEDSARIAAAGFIGASSSQPAAPPPQRNSDEESARLRAIYAGKRLNVPYVLTGTVSQSGDSISVRAGLRAARDGSILWAQAFVEEA